MSPPFNVPDRHINLHRRGVRTSHFVSLDEYDKLDYNKLPVLADQPELGLGWAASVGVPEIIVTLLEDTGPTNRMNTALQRHEFDLNY